MNSKSIIEILKKVYLPQVKTPLGRWNLNNYRQTTLKIKYANEDNCGISSINYKNIIQMQMQPNNLLDEEYIYSMGYESVHDKVK
jgi:hypothetical protein